MVLAGCNGDKDEPSETASAEGRCVEAGLEVHESPIGECVASVDLGEYCEERAPSLPLGAREEGCAHLHSALEAVGFNDETPTSAWDGSLLEVVQCTGLNGSETVWVFTTDGLYGAGLIYNADDGTLIGAVEGVESGPPYCCGDSTARRFTVGIVGDRGALDCVALAGPA
ncbi:MAG: hypothetical protein ACI9OJ_000292 [Myxococcota bacterium]|jgi:hypothetical protein